MLRMDSKVLHNSPPYFQELEAFTTTIFPFMYLPFCLCHYFPPAIHESLENLCVGASRQH